MQFTILILSIWVFVRALSYGIYEIRENKNAPGGALVIFIALLSLIFPSLIAFTKGVV